MTRVPYAVTLERDGVVIASGTRYAWNAAVRASESLTRDYARTAGGMYAGDPPEVTRADSGRTYRRVWSRTFSTPDVVTAVVTGPN